MSDVERLLRSALVPIDPPVSLMDNLERRLTEQVDAAADELADWELGAMRHPRDRARGAPRGPGRGGPPPPRSPPPPALRSSSGPPASSTRSAAPPASRRSRR